MIRRMPQRFGLTFFMFLILAVSLIGQSRIPAGENNWLQVTRDSNDGGVDPIMVVFFEVPDTFTGPIYFGIRDPETNSISPDFNNGETTYTLMGGTGTYSNATARLSEYAATPSDCYIGGTALESFVYNTAETGLAPAIGGDQDWIYFAPVYPSEGEKIGSNYYFRLIAEGTKPYGNTYKNAFQLIASHTGTQNAEPVEITDIKAFAYSWCVDLRQGEQWDLYPFVSDSEDSTHELELLINDMDDELYSLYDIQGNLIDENVANSGFPWSSNTDGGKDYTLGGQTNGTWHIDVNVTGAGPADNTTEFYAEISDGGALADETDLRIYTSPYIPEQPYRVSVVHDESENVIVTSGYHTVNLQLVDSSGNSVPYARKIFLNNPGGGLQFHNYDSSVALAAVDTGYLATTDKDGFFSFTCNKTSAGTVTLTITSDGSLLSDRIPSFGVMGTNDTAVVMFGGDPPTLVSSDNDLTNEIVGTSSGNIDLTITESATGGNLTAANDLYIRIPSTVDAEFDTGLTDITITGLAPVLAKLDTGLGNVTYSGGNKIMHLDITGDLAAGETFTLNDLALGSVLGASSGDFELSYSGASGPWNVVDSRSGSDDIIISSNINTWTGGTSQIVTNAGNWSGGAPAFDGTETILIPDGATTAFDPLFTASVDFKELIIETGGIVEASGTINLNTTDLYQNNGTLRLLGGTITVQRNAVTATHSLGNVVLNSGTTGNLVNTVFDDLTLTLGDWTSFAGISLTINGDFTLTAGIFRVPAAPEIYVYGDWNNAGGVRLYDGGTNDRGIVNFVGANTAQILGSTIFYRLKCQVPGKTLQFGTGTTQTIAAGGVLLLEGSSTSDLNLTDTGASDWALNISAATSDTVSYVNVDYANAEGGVADHINCDYSTFGVNMNPDAANPLWQQTTDKVTTWTGGNLSSNVMDGLNWSNGLPNSVGTVADVVYIPDASTLTWLPVLTGNWDISGNTLIIQTGGILDMAGNTITNTGGSFENNGTLLAQSGASITTGLDTNSGTVSYSAGGAGLPLGNAYHNLILSGGVWTMTANATIGNDLTVSGGSLSTNGNQITNLGRDIYISGTGLLTVNTDLTLNGNLNNTGGVNAYDQSGGGTLTIDGGGVHTILGSNSYNHLTLLQTAGSCYINFENGETQSIGGNFTVTGASGDLIGLKGTTSAVWTINIGGTVNVTYADISYSTASSGPHDAFLSQSSYNNNTGWNIFPGATAVYTWQGDDGTNPTLWNVGENWDVGTAPSNMGSEIIIIPNVVNDPVLTGNTSIDTLTIQAGGVLDTNGFDLVLATPASFSNDGTLILTGDETTLTLTMDTDTGLVRYVDGAGAGTISFTSFKDLEIAGTAQTHSLSGITTVGGDLTVTSGTLACAANNLIVTGILTNSSTISGSTGNITVTGDSVLSGAVTYTGASVMAFNGGVSSLTGTVTSTNGSISLSGGSANVVLTGQLNAGTGTIDIDAGAFEIHGDLDAAYDIQANTIVLDTTSTWIGSTNAIETASPGVCDLQLPPGNRAIRISHNGAVTPNFGANHTSILPFELVATGALTLPANRNISTATTNITLQGSTLTLSAGTGQLVTTTGNISLTATAGPLTLEHDLITDGVTGNVSLLAFGTITQTQPITADLLTAETRVNGGAVLTLNQTNSSNSINLSSHDSVGVIDAGNITYIDSNGFDIAFLETMGDTDLTAGGTANDGTADVTQSVAITAGGLVLRGSGDYQFDQAGNLISTLAANTTGDIYYRENDPVVIGAVGGINGLTTPADIWLRNDTVLGTPEFTQTQSISSNGLILEGNDGDFNFSGAVNSVGILALVGDGTAGTIRASITQNSNLTLGQVDVNGNVAAGCDDGENLTLDLGTGDFIIDDVNVTDWILAGDFTLTADDFDDSLSNTVPGANLSTGGNVTLNLTNATPTAQTNTWIFNGTTLLTISGNSISLNNVQLGDGSTGGSLTLSSAQDIDGSVTALNNGATTLNLGGQTVNLGGNLTLTNLDTFTAAGSTLIMDGGAAQTLTSNGLSLNNLTVNGAGVTAADNSTLTGALTITAGNLDIDGNNLAVTGILSNNTNLLLTGAGAQVVSFGSMDIDSGMVTYDGAGTSLAGLSNFYNLTITGGGVRIFPAAVNVYKDLDTSGITAAQDLVTNTTLLTFRDDAGSTGTFLPPATAADFTFYDMTVEAGNTLTAAGDMIVARNWTNNGSFTHGGNEVEFSTAATSSITGDNTFFNFRCDLDTLAIAKTLSFADSSVQTVAGTLFIRGDDATNLVTMTSPTAAGWTMILTGALGSETVEYSAIQYGQVGGGSNDITADNSVDVGLTCDLVSPGWIFTPKTVIWDGSTDTDWFTDANWDWGYVPNDTDNVIIADVANQPVIDPADPDTITNNLTINAGATSSLEVGNGRSLTVNGTYDNQADLIRSGTSAVNVTDINSGRTIFRNTNGNIPDYGVTDYFNLLIENTMTQTTVIAAAGSLEITGTQNTSGNNLNVTGSITGVGGTLASSAGETVDANGSISVATVTSTGAAQYFAGVDFTPGAFTAGTSSVTLDGVSANLGGLTYNNLIFNLAAAVNTITPGADITVTNSLTMTRGTLNAGTFTHTISGNWDSDNGANFIFNSDTSTFVLGASNITHVGGSGFFNLTLNGITGLNSALEVGNDLLMGATGNLTATASRAITVGGNWTNSGTFDAVNGTVTLTGAGTISGMSGANDFYDLTITDGAHTSNNLDVFRNTIISGALSSLSTAGFVMSTGTLTLSGGDMTNGTSLTVDTGDMIINAGGSSFNGGGTLTVNPGNLTISDGDFDPAGNVTVNGNINITSALALTVGGTLSGNNISYNGGAGSLTASNDVSSGGTFTVSGGTFNLNNNCDLSSTGLLTLSGGALNPLGLVNANLGMTISGGTLTSGAASDMVTVSGGNLLISGGTFTGAGDLDVNGTTTVQTGGTLDGTGIIDFNGNVTMNDVASAFNGNARAMTVSGSWTESAAVFVAGTSTVTFDGGASVIDAFNPFNDLTIACTATLGSGLTVSGDLLITVAGDLTDTGSAAINVAGDWTNSGTYDAVNGTVTLTGAGVISGMSGANDFFDLTITGGAHSTSTALDVANDMILSGGSLDTTGDVITTGSLTLSGGSLVNGTSVTVDTGNMTISNAVSLYSGAGSLTINPGNLSITAGDFTPSGTVSITSGNLTASSTDTMTPTGTITVGGTSTFTGGIFTTSTTYTSTGLIRVNGAGATLTANGTLNGNNGIQVSNGTLNGNGNIDVTGTVTLDGGSLIGTGRTINVNGNWTETVAGYTAVASGTVIIDGASTLTAINPFYNLTISANTNLASSISVGNTLSQTGTANLTSPTAQNITVTADLDLTGTGGGITFTNGGILNVGTTTDLAGGTSISLNGLGNDIFTGIVTNAGTITSGTGTCTFGNTVNNTGTLTSAGTGNITFVGNYVGGSGDITDTGGDSNWIFQGDAAFAGVVMTGDDVIFNTAGAHAVSVTGANSFDQVDIVTGETVNLSGTGTFTVTNLVIDTAGSDNGTAVFDAGYANFNINILDNGGRFRLEGSQGTQTVTSFDALSGWLEYYDNPGNGVSANINLTNGNLASLWNLEISSGIYTLGQNINVLGFGGDTNYDIDVDIYNDQGLFITGGTLNAGNRLITIRECFSLAGGTFNYDTSEVIFTGSNAGFINGNVTFYRLTCSFLAFAHASAAPVGDKDLYFNIGDTITIATGGYLILSGDPTTAPPVLTAAFPEVTSYLCLIPTTVPAAGQYWDLNIVGTAQIYMENVCAWYSDATFNPFILQINVLTHDCPGWLSYVFINWIDTVDSDNNGKIDRLHVEVAVGVLLKGEGGFDDFELTAEGYTVTDYNDGADRQHFYIELAELDHLDTDAVPVVQILNNTTLYDQITSTKVVIIPPLVGLPTFPYHGPVSPTITSQDEAAPVIGYTLAVPGNSEMFIHFSEPVHDAGGNDPDQNDFTLSPSLNATKNGFTIITGGAGAGVEEALISFNTPLTMSDVLTETIDATALQDLAVDDTTPIPLADPNPMVVLLRNNTHPISDILAGPTFDGPVEPLWAVDQTTASSSGSGTGVINEFDGTQHLKDENITLQAHLSTDIPFASLGGFPIELHFIQNPSYTNSNGLWMDNVNDTIGPFNNMVEDDWSGLVPYIQDSSTMVSVNGTADGTNDHVWDFDLSGSDITNSVDLSFLFYLPGIDRYTARIDDHTASDWYRRFYPWSFGVRNIINQGGGVSILNNVINPLKGEEAILYYNLSNAGMISVQVFDLAGGLVEILHRGRQEAGEYSLAWNGTNRSNTPVARGIYFVRIVGPSMDEMRKVLVIK